MTKQILYILLMPVLIFFGCKKDEEIILPTPSPTFFKFTGEIGMNDNSTIVTSDGNLLICANPVPGSCEYGIFYLYKITTTGDLIWSRNYNIGYNSGYNHDCSGIAESSNHEYFICGERVINNQDVAVFKTNSNQKFTAKPSESRY